MDKIDTDYKRLMRFSLPSVTTQGTVIIACVTNGAQGILKPYVAYGLFLVSSRQAQNLRDELYQAKLRLEKETASLKEANKVLC